jgi:hypothetical protein
VAAKTQAVATPEPAKPQAAAEPAAEAPPTGAAPAAGEKTIQRVDKSGMSIDDILAYCRQHDAK